MLNDVNIVVWELSVEIALKIAVTELVGVFELAKIVPHFLYGVIGQVNELVIKVVQVKLLGAGADVPVLEEEPLELLVDACRQPKQSEVELAAVD